MNKFSEPKLEKVSVSSDVIATSCAVDTTHCTSNCTDCTSIHCDYKYNCPDNTFCPENKKK